MDLAPISSFDSLQMNICVRLHVETKHECLFARTCIGQGKFSKECMPVVAFVANIIMFKLMFCVRIQNATQFKCELMHSTDVNVWKMCVCVCIWIIEHASHVRRVRCRVQQHFEMRRLGSCSKCERCRTILFRSIHYDFYGNDTLD